MCTVAMWGEACMSAGLAVFRRRQAVGVAEGAAEGGEAGIAGARPDRLERLVAMGKIGSRTLQPQALHRADDGFAVDRRSEEHTSELQSLMRISYAVFCLKKKNTQQHNTSYHLTKEH